MATNPPQPVDSKKVFEQIATDADAAGKALSTLSTSITKCLTDLTATSGVGGGGAVGASISSVSSSAISGALGGGGGVGGAGSFNPPPKPTITVNLVIMLNDNKTTINSCRIVNKQIATLPIGYKFCFNHQLTFTKNPHMSTNILSPSTQKNIAANTVTFLQGSSPGSAATQNATEITIQEIIINNIINVLNTTKETSLTYKIPPVYLQFDNASGGGVNPWSQVDAAPSTDEDKAKTIEITPDVHIRTTTINPSYYVLSIVDYARFADTSSDIKFIDGATKIPIDLNTAKNINKALKLIKSIKMLGGGKKKRQSRKLQKYTKKLSKGGKKRRQSYRRF